MKYFILALCVLAGGCSSTRTVESSASITSPTSPKVPGAVVVEEGYIYLSDPQESQGFTIGLDQLSANLTRTFSDRDRIYPLQPQGWKIDLKVWVRDQERERFSRISGPAQILSAVDENDLSIPFRPSQREESNPFLKGSDERRDHPPRYARADLWPRELPRKISFRGTIPVQAADKTDSVNITLDEEKEIDLGNDMTATLRYMGDKEKAAKFAPAVVTVRSKNIDWPIIRGTYAVGPDGRTRDLGTGNLEVAPDGSREWTFHYTMDRTSKNVPPAIRIDRILGVKEIPVKFEFSDVPVGAVR